MPNTSLSGDSTAKTPTCLITKRIIRPSGKPNCHRRGIPPSRNRARRGATRLSDSRTQTANIPRIRISRLRRKKPSPELGVRAKITTFAHGVTPLQRGKRTTQNRTPNPSFTFFREYRTQEMKRQTRFCRLFTVCLFVASVNVVTNRKLTSYNAFCIGLSDGFHLSFQRDTSIIVPPMVYQTFVGKCLQKYRMLQCPKYGHTVTPQDILCLGPIWCSSCSFFFAAL